MLEQRELFHSVDARTAPGPKQPEGLTVEVEGKVLEATEVFAAYWYFAAERQRMFFKRLKGANNPALTDDPVLYTYRFTNSYRASDRVSQFLLRNVISVFRQQWTDEDIFYRVLLFKLFNKIDTWEALEREFGELTWERHNFDKLDSFLSRRQDSQKRNYSAAYIMPSAGSTFGHKSKHANHLRLLEWMVAEDYPRRLRNCRNMGHAYDLMIAAPSLGPFLAYQFVTDINYSTLTSFSEMEFVKAGPGALDGIAKCFKSTEGIPSEAIIKHMALYQDRYFEIFEIDFPSLWGRPLQLIDCQNLFARFLSMRESLFLK